MVQLLNDGDLTDKFAAVLKEIFSRFDKDKDGKLSDEELDGYANFLRGEGFSDDEKEQIRDNFDVDEKNRLTESGFLQLYQLQTLSDPDETWDDLTKLGYSKNLEKTEKTEKTKKTEKAEKTES